VEELTFFIIVYYVIYVLIYQIVRKECTPVVQFTVESHQKCCFRLSTHLERRGETKARSSWARVHVTKNSLSQSRPPSLVENLEKGWL